MGVFSLQSGCRIGNLYISFYAFVAELSERQKITLQATFPQSTSSRSYNCSNFRGSLTGIVQCVVDIRQEDDRPFNFVERTLDRVKRDGLNGLTVLSALFQHNRYT